MFMKSKIYFAGNLRWLTILSVICAYVILIFWSIVSIFLPLLVFKPVSNNLTNIFNQLSAILFHILIIVHLM